MALCYPPVLPSPIEKGGRSAARTLPQFAGVLPRHGRNIAVLLSRQRNSSAGICPTRMTTHCNCFAAHPSAQIVLLLSRIAVGKFSAAVSPLYIMQYFGSYREICEKLF
jgi:hypothetical protein